MGSTDTRLVVDPTNAQRWRLDVAGIPQSYVDLDDPTALVFGYVQAFGAVLDSVAGTRFVHVGGGAMTMVRYLAATRPGSTHVVLEPDTDLSAQVLEAMPFALGTVVDLRAVDGAAGVGALAPSAVDVVIVDAAVGDRVPEELTGPGFLGSVERALTPGGVVVGNVPGSPEHPAGVPDAIDELFEHRITLARPGVRHTGIGNVVYAASHAPLDREGTARAAAALDPPQQLET